MTHGDDSGLVLPPAVAPIQLVVIPIASHKEGVTEKAEEVFNRMKKICRAKIDLTDNSPGWKFAEYEMKGVPLRLELGPRDIENNQCVIVRRDNGEKTVVSLDELETVVPEMLNKVHEGMYNKALANRSEKTYTAKTLEEMIDIADNKPGFIKAMWCEDRACEDTLKEKAGVSSRCMPFEQETISDKCVCCGKPAKKMVYWGKAY
jgi:prolyl-tRNA synthetase